MLDQTNTRKKWLEVLLKAKESPHQKGMIQEYFSREFALCPEEFYLFLQDLRLKHLIQSDALQARQLAWMFLNHLQHLCERFGLYEEKQALADQCFAITNPQAYLEIDAIMKKYSPQSNKIIQEIEHILNQVVEEMNVAYELNGRTKNHYSVHRKLQKKGTKDALSLKDIFAFRIIIDSKDHKRCFEALHLLHDHFDPIPDYFKDYISIPKVNGYQSLHTGLTNVIPDLDLPIEVQIRTQSMHDFAEKGLAAHWLYAEEKRTQLLSPRQSLLYKRFQQLVEEPHDEYVYFFAYDGHIYRLESGAYILDFAYSLHSSMGDRVRSALVNGIERGMAYQIQDGDKIELLLSESPQVKPEWEHFTQTKNAKRQVQRALRK